MKYPLSMTAFGRGEAGTPEKKWVIELRSVNHRFCDIKIKMPRRFAALEDRIKKEISNRMSRGHVEALINLTGVMAQATELNANLPLARNYYNCLSEISNELDLGEKPTLDMLLNEDNLISATEIKDDIEALWPELHAALQQALDAADIMRQDEGQALRADLVERLAGFKKTVAVIEESVPQLLQQKEVTLKERLAKLLDGVDLDPTRLAQEVAIIADKSDITEELIRLKSHIQQFESFMDLTEPIGRRIDFLMQEFLREINTMASKINNAATTHLTVDLKNEVEKMREQAANIE